MFFRQSRAQTSYDARFEFQDFSYLADFRDRGITELRRRRRYLRILSAEKYAREQGGSVSVYRNNRDSRGFAPKAPVLKLFVDSPFEIYDPWFSFVVARI